MKKIILFTLSLFIFLSAFGWANRKNKYRITFEENKTCPIQTQSYGYNWECSAEIGGYFIAPIFWLHTEEMYALNMETIKRMGVEDRVLASWAPRSRFSGYITFDRARKIEQIFE